MGLICCVICAFLCLIAYSGDRRIYSPTVVIYGLFALIFMMSSLRLYEMYAVEDTVYFMVMLGLISFGVGSVFARHYDIKGVTTYKETEINQAAYKLVFLITLILSVLYSLGAIRLLLQGNSLIYIYELHTGNGVNDTENLLGHSYLLNLLSVYILTPFSYLLIPTGVCLFFKTKEVKYLVQAAVLMGFRIIYHGGRAILFFTIGYAALLVLMSRKNEKVGLSTELGDIYVTLKRSKRFKRILLIALVLGIAFVIYMTTQRDMEFGKSIYVYFAGCMTNCSERLPEILALDRTYGLLSLRGLFYPISSAMDLFGMHWSFFDYVDDVFNSFQYAVSIAPGINMNAFITMFPFFYIDAGWIGIVLFSIITGYISRIFYRNAEKYADIRSLTIYCIWFINVIVYSFNTYMLSYIQIIWALLFSFLIFRRKRYYEGS